MKKKTDALFSEYIIDGVQMDTTPADMLSECMFSPLSSADSLQAEEIVDESPYRTPTRLHYNTESADTYIRTVAENLNDYGTIDLRHARSTTKINIAKTLLDAIWQKGNFKLEDLVLDTEWQWDSEPVGNMAAFYSSAEAVSQYIYDIGVKINSAKFSESKDEHKIVITLLDSFHTYGDEVFIEKERACASKLDTGDNYLIYIPFDTSSHNLGGSLFGKLIGKGEESSSEMMDPDYFIDCYEVVREFVEDGIVTAGVSVNRGGLAAALSEISGGQGMEADLSGIKKAYLENDVIRILFAEIPGVLIQIRSSDFNYVDAQLMLQDVAYYPLGRKVLRTGNQDIKIPGNERTDIADLLSALMNGQSSEGED